MAAIDMITAANLGVPTDSLRPQNCHEAVLGWLIHGKLGAPRHSNEPWRTVRRLANQVGIESQAGPKQLPGNWFGSIVYHDKGTQIVRTGPPGTPFPPGTLAAGDVLAMGIPQAPHHSVVVTRVEHTRAWVRGFNNAGAFNGPYMDWDPDEHDILDPERWTRNHEFMGINGPAPVYRIRYQDLVDGLPDARSPLRRETRAISDAARASYQAHLAADRARQEAEGHLTQPLADDFRIWEEWARNG